MFEELIQKIAERRGEENPFPDDFEDFLEDFVPNILLKSDTLAIAFGVSNQELEVLYREGYTFYQQDLYKEASNIFRFLVILDPYIPQHWMGLAACQQLLKEYEKALHSYAMVTLLEKENPYPHFHAYECYKALENPQEASVALELAMERAQANGLYSDLCARLEEEVRTCR